jgi:hypothetical protein
VKALGDRGYDGERQMLAASYRSDPQNREPGGLSKEYASSGSLVKNEGGTSSVWAAGLTLDGNVSEAYRDSVRLKHCI